MMAIDRSRWSIVIYLSKWILYDSRGVSIPHNYQIAQLHYFCSIKIGCSLLIWFSSTRIIAIDIDANSVKNDANQIYFLDSWSLFLHSTYYSIQQVSLLLSHTHNPSSYCYYIVPAFITTPSTDCHLSTPLYHCLTTNKIVTLLSVC